MKFNFIQSKNRDIALKQIILSGLFLLIFRPAFSQKALNYNNTSQAGKLNFYIANENIIMPGINTHGIGLSIEYFPTRKLGLYYNITAGINRDNQFAAHTTLGLPAAAAGFVLAFTAGDEITSNFLALASVFTLLIPEGITYKAWEDENITVIPFLGPLGFDYNPSGEKDFPASGTAGLRFRCRIRDNFVITPMVGGKVIYKNMNTGIYAGVLIPIK